jgi:hypothetical protein
MANKKGRGRRGRGTGRGSTKGIIGKSDSVENPVEEPIVDPFVVADHSLLMDVEAGIFPIIDLMPGEIEIERIKDAEGHSMA